MNRGDQAREVRYALCDPRKLCERLGLLDGAKRQAGGVIIRCPSHGERNPSCSVSIGKDGTVRVRCFSCDFSGDALTLVAVASKLDLRNDFRDVLAIGAELAGALGLREEILAGSPMPERARFEAPAPQPEIDYPPQPEVLALWGSAHPVTQDPDAWEYLRGRGLDPEALETVGTTRCLPPGLKTPPWAHYGGKSWVETGHRILVAMFDAVGTLRSVRAWGIDPGDAPKRLPPKGCRATGLVMANRLAWMMLRRLYSPRKLMVMEGEPDFCTASILWSHEAVVGLVTGSWNDAFAAAVPSRTEVHIATHHDDAGDRYAEQVLSTLRRGRVWRAAA